MTGVVTKLTDSMSKFVQASSPATMDRLNFAFEDLYATIGQRLEPIMLAIAKGVEQFGDALSTIGDGGAFKAIADLIELLASVFAKLFKILSPVIKFIGYVVSGFAKLLEGLGWIADKITSFFSWLFGQDDKKSRRATAATGVSFTGVADLSGRAL